MAKHDLGKLYLTQKSLTEWLEDIGHGDVAELRDEDNEKRERLRVLNDVIGLPFDKPVQFDAVDVAENSPEHQKYLAHHGNELCALRLIPRDKKLPKLRNRGRSVKEVQLWFREQQIDPAQYRAEYIAHSDDQLWSTIFVVSDEAIFGEIIRGRHSQLTQGFYDGDHRPCTFRYDFAKWQMEPRDDESLVKIREIITHLQVGSDQQTVLSEKIGATFAHGYLKGYFETTECDEFGLWFVDYAPTLGERLSVAVRPVRNDDAVISGQIGCMGRAEGRVRIIEPGGQDDDFPVDAVLICSVTTPDFVPLMQKACAIVTDNGGILSHAAIVARELGKPCIVGTGNATMSFKTGDRVLVDADKGTVVKL
ncbi:MAG: PEP-utilizing enzyme [Candidatus Saccharimonadales bacterium]